MPESLPDAPPPASPKRRSTLLHRLARAVREQNWFAVALELVIVVLGVVIGFQVSSWGQQRDLREREAAQLAALRDDFLANREQLTGVLARVELAATRQREMLRVIHGHAPRPSRDSLGMLVFSTVTFARFAPVLGAYEAMLSAGDLRLIRDPDLRRHLAHFAELAEAGYEDEEQATMIRVRLMEYLAQHGDILAIVYPEWRAGAGLPESSMAMDLDALLVDPAFSTLVTPMAFVEASMLEYYRDMKVHLDAVLSALGVEAVSSSIGGARTGTGANAVAE